MILIDTDFQFKHPTWIKAKTFNIANNQLLNFATNTSPAAGLYVNEVTDIQPMKIVSSSAGKMLLMT
ncbi:MAG: hypothetical protein AB8U53_04585 [Rickettsia aeschlimannii]